MIDLIFDDCVDGACQFKVSWEMFAKVICISVIGCEHMHTGIFDQISG